MLPKFLQTLRKYTSKEAKKLSERLYRQFSKCSGRTVLLLNRGLESKTAVKHLLNTRMAKKTKTLSDNFPNAVVRTVRLLNRGLWSERRYKRFSKCSVTECAVFQSWPMNAQTL